MLGSCPSRRSATLAAAVAAHTGMAGIVAAIVAGIAVGTVAAIAVGTVAGMAVTVAAIAALVTVDIAAVHMATADTGATPIATESFVSSALSEADS